MTPKQSVTMAQTKNQQPNPPCPGCGAKDTVKKGRRRNRLQTLQIFQCIECEQRFTGAPGKNSSYPLKHILEAISTYNFGYSLTETQNRVRKRTRLEIPERTIRSWLSTHRPLTTYARLRSAGKRLFTPQTMIRTYQLNHRQVYRFELHQAKLQLVLQTPAHKEFAPLTDYLEGVDDRFPHHLFEATHQRSSSSVGRVVQAVADGEVTPGEAQTVRYLRHGRAIANNRLPAALRKYSISRTATAS